MLALPGCKRYDPVKKDAGTIQLNAVLIGSATVNLSGPITVDLPVDQSIVISFSAAVDVNTVQSITIKNGGQPVDVDFSFQDNNKKVAVKPKQSLLYNTQYTLAVSNLLKGANQEEFPGLQVDFKTIAGSLFVLTYKIGGQAVTNNRVINIPLDLSIEINFSAPLNPPTVTANSVNVTGPNTGTLVFTFSNENRTLTITRATPTTGRSTGWTNRPRRAARWCSP